MSIHCLYIVLQALVCWQVRERLKKMGHLQPLNIFLRQEIDRMSRVLTIVKTTLTDLKLAIDGTIIMNEVFVCGLRFTLAMVVSSHVLKYPDRPYDYHPHPTPIPGTSFSIVPVPASTVLVPIHRRRQLYPCSFDSPCHQTIGSQERNYWIQSFSC